MTHKRSTLTSLIILALMASPGILRADGDEPGDLVRSSTLRTVKWSPFHMIDFPPTAQFAFEYPIGRNRTLQHEVGFISNTVNPFSGSRRNFEATGIRLKNEIRYYNHQLRGEGDFYLAPELVYTFYNQKSEEWFTRFDGAYSESIMYDGVKHMVAANFKLGAVFPAPHLPFSWDFFLGFGLKYRYIGSNMPDDAEPNGPTGWQTMDDWYYPQNGSSLRFNLTGGIRIGYILPR